MKLKKTIALVLCILIVIPAGITLADPSSQTASDTGVLNLQPIDIDSAEKDLPNGEYIISVFTDGQWIEAGLVAFNKHLSEKQIDLNGFVTSDKSVKIKISQNKGGSAYIDSVFLGSKAPLSVNSSNDTSQRSPLYKLNAKDLDVLNVGEDGIEIEFANIKGTVINITARIESKVISKEPFQFPKANMFTEVNEYSSFYNYSLNNSFGNVSVDGNIDEVNESIPFLKEYCNPTSGHPNGFIYIWVMNDDEKLYVSMDVTPDNTMDGDKDYGKVYIKTIDGVKEFKVSVPETQWGLPGFIYTDRVNYQHKVYEFDIPLQEIGITDIQNTENVEIAFAAYGTMSVEKTDQTVVYNPNNKNYLCINRYEDDYYDSDLNQWVYEYSLNGYIIDDSYYFDDFDREYYMNYTSFPIYQSNNYLSAPSIALDSINNKYLTTWKDTVTNSVYGSFISDEGPRSQNITVYENVYGNNIHIPSIAFDEYSEQFFAVWQEEESDGCVYIAGQMLDSNGSPIGDVFHVSDATAEINPRQCSPQIISTGNGKFLVLWNDNRTSNDQLYHIYGRFINSDGTKNETDIKISSEAYSNYNYGSYPIAAYDNINDKFLITWANVNSSYNYRVVIQMLDGNGNLIGSNLNISELDMNQFSPSVSFDTYNNQFLVIWSQQDIDGDWQNRIFGRYVDSYDSTPNFIGEVFAVTGDSYLDYRMPSIAYNDKKSNFFVSYISNNDGQVGIGFSKVVSSITPTIKPPINKLITDNVLMFDLNGEDIKVDIDTKGNELNIYTNYYYVHEVLGDYINLNRDGYSYKKYKPQTCAFIPKELMKDYGAGNIAEVNYIFDSGEKKQLNVCVVDSTTGDSLPPAISTPYTGDIIPKYSDNYSKIELVFSELIHEYSQLAVEEAIMNNAYFPVTYDVGIDWTVYDEDTNPYHVLTIEYYGYEDIYWNGDLEVEIMDYAGNTDTVKIIDTTY